VPVQAGSPLNQLTEADIPSLDRVWALQPRNPPRPNLSNKSRLAGARFNLVGEMPIRETEIQVRGWLRRLNQTDCAHSQGPTLELAIRCTRRRHMTCMHRAPSTRFSFSPRCQGPPPALHTEWISGQYTCQP
jgi:hypothetical protein